MSLLLESNVLRVLSVGQEGRTYGRILRGRSPDQFITLSDDRNRKIVMVMGMDGLEKFLGKNGYCMLVEIGHKKNYIRKKLDEGCSFKLVTFESEQPLMPATWENVIIMVEKAYPGTASKLERNILGLEASAFDSTYFTKEAGFDFQEAEENGMADPRFMTYGRFLASQGTLLDARSFLYFTIHLKELFAGNGYTYTDDGKVGMKEYLFLNRPVSELTGALLFDMHVEFCE